jgi:hypothetical protein
MDQPAARTPTRRPESCRTSSSTSFCSRASTWCPDSPTTAFPVLAYKATPGRSPGDSTGLGPPTRRRWRARSGQPLGVPPTRRTFVVSALAEAETLTPEQVRSPRHVREMVRDLLRDERHQVTPELRALAKRVGALAQRNLGCRVAGEEFAVRRSMLPRGARSAPAGSSDRA